MVDIRIKSQINKSKENLGEMILSGTMAVSICYLLFTTGHKLFGWIVIAIFVIVLLLQGYDESKKS